MFNGVPPEQFHQFIASRSALPLPLPLTLPHLQVTSPNTFTLHDQLFQQQQQQQPPPHHLFQQLHGPAPHRQSSSHEEPEEKDLVEEREGVVRSIAQEMDPWLKDEVVALLTIRSNLGDDFSDFIWGHVSRKLGELGYKRSAEKCKEKFEEVSRYCSSASNTTSYNTNYRTLGELEALFEDQNTKSTMEHAESMVEKPEGVEGEQRALINLEENSGNETLENPIVENQNEETKPKKKKRKKYSKLELLQGFSDVMNKILVQQDLMHKKLLDDIEKREKERVAQEEARRKEDMDRLNKEMEKRAREQAITSKRDVTIIEFLKNFTLTSPLSQNQVQKEDQKIPANNSNVLATPQNSKSFLPNSNAPSSSALALASSSLNHGGTPTNATQKSTHDQVYSPAMPREQASDFPSPFPNNNVAASTSTTPVLAPPNLSPISGYGEEYGKRWPREEVLSLINLRCNICTNGEDKESTKAPLWEKISQGMSELKYQRSAKKCKEKWENINKYFRKTRDANKKRPVDSKTCPYFHQLHSFYSQGRPITQQPLPEAVGDNHSGSMETLLESKTPESHIGQSSAQGANAAAAAPAAPISFFEALEY